jgi:hypothetical protein
MKLGIKKNGVAWRSWHVSFKGEMIHGHCPKYVFVSQTPSIRYLLH